MDIKYITDQLIQSIKEIGKVMVHKSDTKIVMEKGDAANLVTNIDILVQNLLIERCKVLIPEAGFIAEENDISKAEEWSWIIDPIDGTCNYTYDFLHSCISVALYHGFEGILGVVYNPFTDECFAGLKDYGAYMNGNRIFGCHHDLAHSLVMVGTTPYEKNKADLTFDVMKRIFLHTSDIRRSGSAALDLCYVACGRADAFYEACLSPWDYAAGIVILKEAGVCVELLSNEVEWVRCGVIAGNLGCFDDFRRLVLFGE